MDLDLDFDFDFDSVLDNTNEIHNIIDVKIEKVVIDVHRIILDQDKKISDQQDKIEQLIVQLQNQAKLINFLNDCNEIKKDKLK